MRWVDPRPHLLDVERWPHATKSRRGIELMDRNERTIDFPHDVIEELHGLLTSFTLRAYPEPAPLYDELAAWLNLPREMLLLTTGADGGLRTIFDTFVEPRDEVVSPIPSYGMIPVYCGISGAILQGVRFNSDLSIDIRQVLNRINDRTKLVILANPSQPIERLYSEEEMVRVLEKCERRGALLVVDEAYHHFCPITALPLLKVYGNLIIVRTFSKAFGIAGVRLGYLISRPENITHLNKVRPMYEVHSMAVAIGLYLLKNDHLMKSYVAEVKEGMAFLTAALRRFGLKASGQWGNSILVTLPADLSGREVAEALKARGFLIRVEVEPPLSNHIRITVGPKAQAERLLGALESVLEVPH